MPIGAAILIIPVATVQVGCVTEAVGAAGITGGTLTVTEVTGEIQPLLLFAVRLYARADSPVNDPVVLA